MLSTYERYMFIMLVVICLVAGYNTFSDMFVIIGKGRGSLPWKELPTRVVRRSASLP